MSLLTLLSSGGPTFSLTLTDGVGTTDSFRTGNTASGGSPTHVGTATFTPSTSGLSPVSFALPTGIPAGAVGILLLSTNTAADTLNAGPTNNGVAWTHLSTQAVGTTLQTQVFRKSLGTADSGTTLTANWQTGGKLTGIIVVFSDASYSSISSPVSDNTTDTTLDIPSITPTIANAFLLAVAGGQHPTSAGVTFTSPWSELAEANGTTALPITSCVVATRQATNAANEAVSATSATWASASRDAAWVVSLEGTGSSGTATSIYITDNAGTTDSASVVGSTGHDDSAGLTDNISIEVIRALTIDESTGLTDSLSVVSSFAQTVDDSTGLTDESARASSAVREFTETAGLTDSTTVESVLTASVSDDIGLSDNFSALILTERFAEDSAGITDSITLLHSAAGAGDPEFVGATGYTPSGTGSSFSVTLPANIPNGSLGILMLNINNTTDSITSGPTNNGSTWTARANTTVGTVLGTRLFSKSLGSSDSSTNITGSWNGPGKLSGGVIVISNAEWSSFTASTPDNSVDSLMEIPAITPSVNDAFLVSITGGVHGIGTGITYPGTWTERLYAPGQQAIPVNSCAIATRVIVGGSGVQVNGTNATWTEDSRDAGWVVALAPSGGATAHSLTVNDSVGLRDSVALEIPIEQVANDNVGLVDSISLSYAVTVTDDSGLSDSVSTARTRTVTATDNVGVRDTYFHSQVSDGFDVSWDPNTEPPPGWTVLEGATTDFTQSDGTIIVFQPDSGIEKNLGNYQAGDTIVVQAVGTGNQGIIWIGTNSPAEAGSFDLSGTPVNFIFEVTSDGPVIVQIYSYGDTLEVNSVSFTAYRNLLTFDKAKSLADNALSGDEVITSLGGAETRTADDNSGLSDSISITVARAQSATDSTGLTDTVSTSHSAVFDTTDNTGLTDAVVVSEAGAEQFTDTVTLTDTVTAIVLSAVANDNTGLTDTTITAAGFTVTRTDSTGLTDEVSTSRSAVVSETDNAGLTDTVSLAASKTLTITDTSGLTDASTSAASFVSTATDNAGLTDATTRASDFVQTQTDNTGLTDLVSSIETNEEFFTDSTGLTDNVLLASSKILVIDDNVGLSDSADLGGDRQLSFTDSTALTDDDSYALTYSRSLTDDLNLTDTASLTTIFAVTTSDDISLTDTTSHLVAFSRSVDDLAGVTDSYVIDEEGYTELVITDSVLDTPSDTITRSATYLRTVTDSSGLTDTASRGFTKTAQDSAGLSDTTSRALGHARSTTDSTGLTDTNERVLSRTRTDTDSTGLTDSIEIAVSRVQTDTTGLTDSVVIEETTANTLDVLDGLDLTDTIILQVGRSLVITETVSLTDLAGLAQARHLTVLDNIGLRDTVTKVRTGLPWYLWTGSTMVPLSLMGIWDGNEVKEADFYVWPGS